MSNRVIDGASIFTGEDVGKDGIRKELGVYYEIEDNILVAKINPETPYILRQGIATPDTSAILPFYTQTLNFTTASFVEDYQQWANNLKSKYVPNVEYIDHFYNMDTDFSSIDAINNYESFDYEDLSKAVPPLSLLNIHDEEDFPVDSAGPAGAQMRQFVDQFSINRSETTSRKNLFFGSEKIKDIKIGHLQQLGLNVPNQPNKPYNYYTKIKPLSSVLYSINNPTTQEILFDQTKMMNKLFAFFKRTTGAGLDFYLDTEATLQQINVKSFTDFLSGFNLIALQTEPDEKFYKDYDEASRFESQFLRLEMLSRIRDFVSQRMRKNFNKVLIENSSSPSLILGYKIQKFISGGTQPIQTTYIMTPRTRDYYDSLLSYDTNYRYEIKAITMVLGNSYSYTTAQENPEEGQLNVTFINRPSLQFLEVPVLTQEMIVTDIPNPPPEIDFYNERGNRNEIIITLDQATIVENSSPNNYPQYFSNDYTSQNKVFTQQKNTQIEFSTLYTSNIYEIYRIDNKPLSYQDFENNLIALIGEPGIELTDNLFRDTIAPQKKYYYLIRTLTNFGIHSNPTRIYEVELIQDSDETFLNYSEFKFEEIENTSNQKMFKRFLQIKPSLPQVALKNDQITDLSTADNYSDTIVGTDPDLIWGRKFKIRVKSKKTGKLFDLNVTFNLKDENNQPI
tara:strand:+ start:8728 stop:10764 length:2037 start_codon:yes stop_codon:yes gene_type:complete